MQALNLRSTSCIRTQNVVRPRTVRSPLVVKAIAVPPEYGYVIASVAVSAAICQWQGVLVGMARRKYGVPLPKMYADGDSVDAKTFNCTQRAHQNTLENLPGLLAMQCLVGLRNPLFAAVLGTIWNIGRVIYTFGYSTGDPNKRTPGFAISWLAYVVLIGATAYAGVSIAGLLS